MITELGHFFLHFALILSLLLAVLPHIALYNTASSYAHYILASTSFIIILLFSAIITAFFILTWGFIHSDFSLMLVQQHSASLSPLLYKITGVWGNHEGSLLLWVVVLSFFALLMVIFGKNLDYYLKNRTLAIQGLIIFAFLVFMIFTSNPFNRLDPAPYEGADLNPLLQDPGLAFHPPMLYIGYVGISIVFSMAIAGLINNKTDRLWARWLRPWTLLAWIFLTAGIALGSWWAYYELGWGGFWFWDPVENASFIPWLITTALLHSTIVSEKRDIFKAWTILLAILAFAMSLTGTFLVRSGILTSVHAFANDPERGFYILILLAICILGALSIYAIKAPTFIHHQPTSLFKPLSRESFLLGNNIILSISALTILLGTLYPIFLDIIIGQQISVGAPYYNISFGILMIPILLSIGFGPLIAWKKGNLSLIKKYFLTMIILWAGLLLFLYLIFYPKHIGAIIGFMIACWVMASTVITPVRYIKQQKKNTMWHNIRMLPRHIIGVSLAHFGVGVILAGIIGTSMLTTTIHQYSTIGARHQLDDVYIRFQDVTNITGDNYQSLAGVFIIEDQAGNIISNPIIAERRHFFISNQQTTEAAIHTHFLYDYHFIIGEQADNGQYLIRLQKKPLVLWLWIGAILMIIGGVFSLTDRRWRLSSSP